MIAAWLFAGWLTVEVATAAHPARIDARTSFVGVPVEEVETETEDQLAVRGWLVRGSEQRIVILFAGHGGNRTSMLGQAEFYLEQDWAVLLPDLRATGESGGEHSGLGYAERLDVAAWMRFVRERGFEEIGLHGQSLGAAAIAYAIGDGLRDYTFLVLDSMYDDVRHALHNRLAWIPFPALALKSAEWFASRRLGVSLDELRPIDCMPSIDATTLFISGKDDPYVSDSETEGLFWACGWPKKVHHPISSVRHEDLWLRDPEEYTAALEHFFRFLGEYTR